MPQLAAAPSFPAPDLLDAAPRLTLDHDAVARQLVVAFETGDAERSLERVMDHAVLPDSTWTGSSFRQGLYVDVLLSTCMAVNLGGFRPRLNRSFLSRLLELPPRNAETRDCRRRILHELAADAKLRDRFERMYKRAYKLRIELQALDTVGLYDSRVRRLFVLSLIRDLIVEMRTSFADSSSALHRIHTFAQAVTDSAEFRHLTDLLDYEDNLALVQFQMRLGADGRIRRFEVTHIRENERNPFHRRPWRRVFGRLGMVLRGYQVSESGLFDAWLDDVFARAVTFLPQVLQLLGQQEFFLIGLGFLDRCRAHGLPTCFPRIVEAHDTARRHADGLFNPLLFAQSITPVPCSLDHDALTRVTVLTGPNSGGKTRLLQALGITQVLAEVGLYAPVADACLTRANGLFVSLGSDDAVDQSEGRLGTELLRIRHLFEASRRGVLVLLDELCSGTNPSEGEEIFRLVLNLLDELDARAMVATHFLDFARQLEREANAHRGSRRAFLQVAIDSTRTLTYQFERGIAKTSMAEQVAARLGVTRSDLEALVGKS